MTHASHLDDLHGILTKLTEKQRAIWTGNATSPPAGSPLALDPTLVQDALEVMLAAAANPEAGIAAWLRWSERGFTHAASPLSEKTNATPLHNAWLRYLQGFHNLAGEAFTDMVSGLTELEEQKKQRFLFYFNQWMEALSPANNLFTNPELLAYTLECQGENLIRGFDNLLNDISCSSGELSISMTDNHAFEVGRNLATTAGTVVVRNEVMELIQYAPTTDTVYKRPMLLVPPWINKYYILDLTEKISMVKWLTDQGYTVFLVSWINPDGSQTAGSFTDYMKHGILAALSAIEAITGEKKPHAAGYCTGGTLLATTLAWLAAGGEDRVASATFMATLIDFTEPGDLGIFINPDQVEALTEETRKLGYLDGKKTGPDIQHASPQRPHLELCDQKLPQGRGPHPL
jgi:polyhydroxyalkanoate synthase